MELKAALKKMIGTRLRALKNWQEPLYLCYWVYFFPVVISLNFIALMFDGVITGVLFALSLCWMAFTVPRIVFAVRAYEGNDLWSDLAIISTFIIVAVTIAGFASVFLFAH